MRGFRGRRMAVRPVVMAAPRQPRRRRRIGPLAFIPVLVAMGVVAYFVMKQMG